MLDLAMDIPMLLDTTTLARGLLMPSPRPRLMLILLFYMVPIMVVWVTPDMDMLDLAMDMVDMAWDMLDMLDMPLTPTAMLATLMPGEN